MSQRAPVEITDANFDGFATGKVTFLGLWAPWYAGCGSLAPLCDRLGGITPLACSSLDAT